MFSPGKEFKKSFQPSAVSRQVNPFTSPIVMSFRSGAAAEEPAFRRQRQPCRHDIE
jgi:hypothetical protein